MQRCKQRRYNSNKQELFMSRKVTATIVLALSLAGTAGSVAQTPLDFWRYRATGYGQCFSDEGYGRYSHCNGASGGN